MNQIKKISVGIRPASKMFRVSSLGGIIIDTVLEARGSKNISDNYYSQIGKDVGQNIIRLTNDEMGNILHIDSDNIVFTKDAYDSEESINVERVLQEFSAVWNIVDSVMEMKKIRRVGIVSEQRFRAKVTNASRGLIEALTKLSAPAHPAKFHMTYENRMPTLEGLAPDINKSDFINVIVNYYDGEIDVEHPNIGDINVNIDVQRYYSPLLNGHVFNEVNKLSKTFLSELEKLRADLIQKGMVHDGKE